MAILSSWAILHWQEVEALQGVHTSQEKRCVACAFHLWAFYNVIQFSSETLTNQISGFCRLN